jgi:heme exporter protein A
MKLIADDVTCIRGGRTVFESVSFALADGESLLLTGPNGAGKTSLLRIVAGLLAPAAGRVRMEGAAGELTIGERSHYVGHLNAVKTAMSVEENVSFWAAFCGVAMRPASLDAFDLARHAAIPAALLSAGQRRRLALTRLAAVPRPIWLLDEPTVGLDTASTAALVALMRAHLGAGGIIAASSHVDIDLDFDHALALGREEIA